MPKLSKPKPHRAKPSGTPINLEASNDNSETQSPQRSEPSPQMTTHQTTTSPLPPELSGSETLSSVASDSDAHLQALAEDATNLSPAPDAGNDNSPPALGITADGIVDRETFRKSFIGSFNLGGNFIQALSIDPAEEGAANAASDALYDTCCEIHWLRPLLHPGGVWVPRLMAIGMFAFPKFKAVQAEIAARREAAKAKAAA